MEIMKCKKCGFILNTRPNFKSIDGVCMPCLNNEKKKIIDFESRQKWLTQYVAENINSNSKWDCVVGVSGGKDSTAIVKRLIENHGVKNPLLINVTDEFTHSEAGMYNLKNLALYYNLDTITFRCEPKSFIKNTRKDFFETLHPLKWIEQQLYEVPLEIAKKFGINLVFYGENSDFEYGGASELGIFHPASDEKTKLIFLGAIYPYSNYDSLKVAKEIGWKTLGDCNEWYRQGSIDDFAQIDSIGYMVHHWCKFIKFGFQRVSDMASRFVREGYLSKEQAEELIKEKDYIIDPKAKSDFCKILNISEREFNETVDKFANNDLLIKDKNGNWRRKDLY
ncbi:flagellin modification protein PseA [Mycoplasmatota bacterium]|nr:flagellin modification protein PseA [Mycoplasmatota bacterium]